MNYWASEFNSTGERDALRFVKAELAGIARPVVFDVGANIGEFSRACLAAFGGRCSLYALEPSRLTFEALQHNLGDTSASLHCLAASDRDGEAVLHTDEPGSTIASLEALDRPVRPFQQGLEERVVTATLDGFCARQDIAHIDFLKLDIEGHEWKALLGASRMLREKRIGIIQFEFGENNVSSRTFLADFVQLLQDYNFYRIVPGGPVRWHYEGGRSEIYATMNYLAVRHSVALGEREHS